MTWARAKCSDCCSAATSETIQLLAGGDCCGGGNYATAKGGTLAKRPSTLCTFFCALELGLDSASLVSWAKPKEDGGRRRMILQGNQSRYAWAGHELAPMLQLTQDLSFCSTVTSWKCLPHGSRLPWKETCYTSLSARHPTSLLCTRCLLLPPTLASRSNPPCYSLLDLTFRLEISEAWLSIRMHKEF